MFVNGKRTMIEIIALIGAAILLVVFLSAAGLALFIVLCLVFNKRKIIKDEDFVEEDWDDFDDDYYDDPEIVEEFDNYEILCPCEDEQCPFRFSESVDKESFIHQHQKDGNFRKNSEG